MFDCTGHSVLHTPLVASSADEAAAMEASLYSFLMAMSRRELEQHCCNRVYFLIVMVVDDHNLHQVLIKASLCKRTV